VNTNWIRFHLLEAKKELTQTISDITDSAYTDYEFEIAMAHLYHHLNTAWNSRNVELRDTAAASDDDFYAWRTFPSDISMGRP
jgi:hypothetical protein